MLRLFTLLFVIALSALIHVTVHAQEPGDSVKSGQPPYKPGRQIIGDAPNATENDGKPVKPAQPPYKPGRQLEVNEAIGGPNVAASPDEPGQPVKSTRPPYKPGRQVDTK